MFQVSNILLNTTHIDWDAFKRQFTEDWDIDISAESPNEDCLVFTVDWLCVSCMFIPVPVPNNEAVLYAKNNCTWQEAVEVASSHQAHVIVSILDPLHTADVIECLLLHTKVVSSLLKLDNAIGVYQSPTVLSPELYIHEAQRIYQGALPILTWVYIGLYQDEDGVSGFTSGLDKFGKDEIEIIGSQQEVYQIYDMLASIAAYVIQNNVKLKDGETIGMGPEQKLKITRSKGVAMNGESLKIAF